MNGLSYDHTVASIINKLPTTPSLPSLASLSSPAMPSSLASISSSLSSISSLERIKMGQMGGGGLATVGWGVVTVLVVLVVLIVASMLVCHHAPQRCPSIMKTLSKKGTSVVTKGRSLIGGGNGEDDGEDDVDGDDDGDADGDAEGDGDDEAGTTDGLQATQGDLDINAPQSYRLTKTANGDGVFTPKPHSIVVVYADWCGYSERFIKGDYKTFESNHANDNLGLIKVEVGSKPLYEAVERYLKTKDEEIMGFPTIYYVTPSGKVRVNNVGRSPAKMEEFVNANKSI